MILRLTTKLVDLNEHFADDMKKKKHTVKFFSFSFSITEFVPAVKDKMKQLTVIR